MDHICPVCNGLESIHIGCNNCGHPLDDNGRYQDYFDDYSAYMDMEEMKKIDGIQNDFRDHKCPHLLHCPNCSTQSIFLIQEL